MKVVNPNNTSHTIKLISRYYPADSLILYLYNEATQVETSIDIDLIGISFVNYYNIVNGYINIDFDFTFSENEKYSIKLADNKDIIYRGKLIATTEETQNYLADNNEYYYE